jgi:hypothetical protein
MGGNALTNTSPIDFLDTYYTAGVVLYFSRHTFLH